MNVWSIAPLDSTQAYPVNGNLPFQIYRRPVKSLASAVQLTDGVAIDLAFSAADFNLSGTNFIFAQYAATRVRSSLRSRPPLLDLVYIVSSTTGQASVFRPLSGVYLLIGKIEKIRRRPYRQRILIRPIGKTSIAAGWASACNQLSGQRRSGIGSHRHDSQCDYQPAARPQQSEHGGQLR